MQKKFLELSDLSFLLKDRVGDEVPKEKSSKHKQKLKLNHI